jgi:phosphatidylglycerophosphate synthase
MEVSGATRERFSRAHASAMLVGSACALALGEPTVAAATGACSLCAFALGVRGRWTPSGRFGAANAVTLSRLVLTLLLAALGRQGAGPREALLLLLVFGLDSLDGWLARTRGDRSEFGETFDMESDALLVMTAGLVLHDGGRLGAFILVPGLLRYGYVLAVWGLSRARGRPLREMPRMRWASQIFGLMAVALATSLWPIEPVHEPLAVLASGLIALSFARSLYWSLSSG